MFPRPRRPTARPPRRRRPATPTPPAAARGDRTRHQGPNAPDRAREPDMKLKGISPLEQNVDRIVLGVTSVALLGAVALQFLGGGNTIKVGTEQVQPAQAYDPVVREAKKLNDTLDRPDLKPPELPAFTLGNKLNIGAASPKIAKVAGPALRRPPRVNTAIKPVQLTDTFAAFKVPSPTDAVAYMFESTISPVEVLSSKNAGLEKLVPAEQPFDKPAISIQARFSGAAL